MSGSQQDHSPTNVVSIGSLEVEEILINLRSLRDEIVAAWSERCVLLTREEQDILHAEIQQTCALLVDLTQRA